MKRLISMFIGAVTTMALLSGCSSHRALLFANREWHISDYFGQIIDTDTTYRMTFGNVLIPRSPVIVSSVDSVSVYPGMDKFLADILHTVHLDSAEILFYAPEMGTMFAIPKSDMSQYRPSSITVNLAEDNQYTMWINDDDVEDWNRQPSEMYTYTYVDKSKHRLLIVDIYDYGTAPLAQITIAQPQNKVTDAMNVPVYLRTAFFKKCDISKYYRDIEFWSHLIEMRRQHAIANYKIGQEQMEGKTLHYSR